MNAPEGNTDIIRKEWSRSKAIWTHGLIAAFVGGFSGAGSAGIATFALGDGLNKAIECALVTWVFAGASSAFLYLKQSPVPPLPKDLVNE